ncbi:hypothetical protein EON80_25345 [bacterium]|nr:MAG: hypothetical protein EON80_25345 [bacterium]
MNLVEHTDPTPIVGQGWKYDTAITAGYEAVPFHYLAGVGQRLDYGAATVLAERRKSININDPLNLLTPRPLYTVPMATSISLSLGGAPTSIENETWNATLGTPGYDQTTHFGFNPNFVDAIAGVPTDDILTGDQSFYQGTALTDPLKSTLDSRRLPLLAGTSSFVLRESDGLATPALMPDYLLMGTKLENVAITSGSDTVEGIAPAHEFDVRAYVYAQTGSWFVISTPAFNNRLHGDLTQTFLDINENGTPDLGEFIKGTGALPTWEPGDFADLNRNGTIDSFERVAMLRYSRYNYSINFTGAIAENQTALINDFGTTAKGAVSTWTDKTATVNYNAPTGITPTLAYDRIKYIFDPSLAQGSLDNEGGFLMPQTSELFNII